MHSFYFNDCIPKCDNPVLFSEKLSLVVKQFSELLNKNINIERGIVTHKQPSQCSHGDGFSLKDTIELINDKSIRNFAYSLFTKFPIGLPYFDDRDDSFIYDVYECQVGGESFDGINLAIVARNSGYLFTVPVHKELESNEIQVLVKGSNEILRLPNLFGEINNAEVIENLIKERNLTKLAKLDQLVEILGAKLSKVFEKDFSSLDDSSQGEIIDHFLAAKKRGMVSFYSADGDLIKDVTPTKNKCSVFELRVRKGRELRVYFNETGEKTFLASIGYKNNNQQDQNIIQAHNILYKLILVNK